MRPVGRRPLRTNWGAWFNADSCVGAFTPRLKRAPIWTAECSRCGFALSRSRERLQNLLVFIVRADPEPEDFVARGEDAESAVAAPDASCDETARSPCAFEMKSRMPRIRPKQAKRKSSLRSNLWRQCSETFPKL